MEEHPEIAYLGINVADTAEDAASFVERHGWKWPSLEDPERARARELGAMYQPHFVLIDAEGRVVDTWEGRGDDAVWEAMLARLP